MDEPLLWIPHHFAACGHRIDMRRELQERPLAYFGKEALIRRGQLPARRFYKYTKAKYANSFIEEGSFRVGTLHDYKRREKYAEAGGILDVDEGRMSLYQDFIEPETWTSNDDIPEVARGLFDLRAQNCEVVVGGTRIQREFVSENLFVFCLSIYRDEVLMPEFENADACYEITAPVRFVTDAIEAMRPHGEFMGVFPCRYIGRNHPWGTPDLNPLVLKPIEKAHQGEVRLVWRPHRPISTDGEIVYSRNLIGRARRVW